MSDTAPPSRSPAVAHAGALVASCADKELVLHAGDLRDTERRLSRTLARLKPVSVDESASAEFGDVRRALTDLNRGIVVTQGQLARALAVLRVYQRAVDEELLARASAEEAAWPEVPPALLLELQVPDSERGRKTAPEAFRPSGECLHEGRCATASPWACCKDALVKVGSGREWVCDCGGCHPGDRAMQARVLAFLDNAPRTVDEVVAALSGVSRPWDGDLAPVEQEYVDEVQRELERMVAQGELVRSLMPGDEHHHLLERTHRGGGR